MLNRLDTKIQIFLTGFIFLLCYSILLGYSLGPQTSLDTYWHLQMGKDLIENGLSPWVDHYSFTFPGKEISTVPVLFQIILATLSSTFGEASGYIVFKIVYVSLLLSFIYIYFKQIKAPWFIICTILPIMIYFITMRLVVRPDTISNIMVIICLSLYFNARENFSTKSLLPLFLLMLLWVNFHTPIIGDIIVFGLFLDRAIHKLTSNTTKYTWNLWLIWGALIFITGFLHPSFRHVIIQLLISPSNGWHQYLSEYTPSYIIYSTNKMVLLSWCSSIIVFLWAFAQKQYGIAFIVAVLCYFSLTISRLVPTVSLINFSLFALLLSQINYENFFTNLKQPLRWTIAVISIFIIGLSFSHMPGDTFNKLKSLGNYQHHVKHMQRMADEKFPAQISDYLNSFHKGGNVLNTFNVGGYLLHTLSPDFKIYIDGRTNILYDIKFYEHYLEILTNTEVMKKDIKKYDIKYAIFEHTPRAHNHFNKTDSLSINFANERYILFSRNNDIAFPISSKLILFPMCWNDTYSDIVQTEIDLSERIFKNKNYTIKFLLEILGEYTSSENKPQFLNTLEPKSFKPHSIKRLIAYLAIKNNNYQLARDFFISIRNKNNTDLLMTSYSSSMIGEHEAARSALSYYFNNKGGIDKNQISDYDKKVIIKILTAAIEGSETESSISINIDQIKMELGMNNSQYIQSLSSDLPYDEICNEIF